MASSLHCPVTLFAVFPLLSLIILHCAIASTSHHHHHNHNHELKSLHFSLYQHDTINQTVYVIVKGVVGPGVGQVADPFGTIYVFQEPMTVTANRSSAVVGVVQGSSTVSSFDGLESIAVAKITLNMKHYKGSLSVLGVTHSIKPADHPVVGGTGDFLFVQGYVTSSPVDFKGNALVYKIEFHLYWPPYATKLMT